MSLLADWTPVRFDPETERAYTQHMLDRLIPLGRVGYSIGIAAFMGYFGWDTLFLPEPLLITGPYRLGVVILLALSMGLTFTTAMKQSANLFVASMVGTYSIVSVGFTLVLAQIPGGFGFGLGGYLLGMIFVPALVFGTLQAALVLLPLILFPLGAMAVLGASGLEIWNAAAWLCGGANFAIGFSYVLTTINRRAFQLEQMLADEKQRSEDLLLNILPSAIADRLKAGEEPIADHVDNATVLFADLVGFTELSRTTAPARLVDLLNDLFSRFDSLVEKHGAEKIKTIGDAYMVAAGLSGSRASHVADVANLALDMKEAFAAFRNANDVDLKLRIGIHSGAVVAGVIGTRKFAYDLWGDTVNVASRMESEGLPDEIQISEKTTQQLPPGFAVEPRGEITIKGHLPQNAYLLQRQC